MNDLYYNVKFDTPIHIRVLGKDMWIDPKDINWEDLQEIMDTPEPFITSHTKGYVYPNPNDALIRYMLEYDLIEIQPDFDINETPDDDYVEGPLNRDELVTQHLSGNVYQLICHHSGVFQEPLK